MTAPPTVPAPAPPDDPDAMDVQVERIGRFQGGAEDPLASLSERQREALEAGLDLGYYDRPRTATHDDIADALGCAPPTASEHLQKAEAALVRAALDGLRRGSRPDTRSGRRGAIYAYLRPIVDINVYYGL